MKKTFCITSTFILSIVTGVLLTSNSSEANEDNIDGQTTLPVIEEAKVKISSNNENEIGLLTSLPGDDPHLLSLAHDTEGDEDVFYSRYGSPDQDLSSDSWEWEATVLQEQLREGESLEEVKNIVEEDFGEVEKLDYSDRVGYVQMNDYGLSFVYIITDEYFYNIASDSLSEIELIEAGKTLEFII
ncbi:hypothetical protein [Geomicrobium sp. JCM 19039]|uniref:hypothetical protein n=1 Tax=Geomicrobium sp. JCM 19039 TaxID=1460636 RepID=UPI00045F38EF|nr:hypothetical protein [Geomicrobium sp. JCM 19039]GAK14153.1 hypothetical protein JCM19039_4050 [Geomicrobium sp. JCM 19039]